MAECQNEPVANGTVMGTIWLDRFAYIAIPHFCSTQTTTMT